MGTGRDKKKKAKEKKVGPVAGKGSEKTERKTRANEEKKDRRADKRLAGDEDDLDALLAKVALEDRALKAVTLVTDAPPPSARVNASFVPYVTPRGSEIILFGGEWSDHVRGKVYVYKDLYRFNPDKQRWTQVLSKGPTPRCAHQAFVHRSSMYVWGGEFSSPNQERFMHFRDLWRLDLATNEWDQLPLKGGPSARSGHRVAVHKGRALLFGGFYDNGRDVKYYNDLWALDLAEMAWTPLGSPGAGPWPAARSGCQLAVAGDTLFMYGGYVKDKDDEDEDLEHGKAHDDMWALDLNTHTVRRAAAAGAAPRRPAPRAPPADAAAAAAAAAGGGQWERVKKAGMAPGPRSSFAMASHKNRAFLFGGVSDNETKRGEDLSSEFHNDLYTFSFANRRWFAAQLRPPKDYKQQAGGGGGDAGAAAEEGPQQQPPPPPQQRQAGGGGGGASGSSSSSSAAAGGAPAPPRQAGGAGGGGAAAGAGLSRELGALLEAGQDKDSPIYRAAVRIQSRFRGYVVRKAYKLYQLGGVVSEILYSPAAYGLDMSVRNMPKPRARISPQVAVVGNTLWLLGGVVEVGEAEITLDDMWSLDLAKLDGWNLVKENTVGRAAAGCRCPQQRRPPEGPPRPEQRPAGRAGGGMVKKKVGGAHRYRALAGGKPSGGGGGGGGAPAGAAAPAAEAAAGGGGPRPPSHVQRKLSRKAKFLDKVVATGSAAALAVGRGGVKKRRRRAGAAAPLPSLASLAGELDSLQAGLAAPGARARAQPGKGTRSSVKRAKARLALGVAEGARLAAVLGHPQYRADPVAAITNHLTATLPPPPAPPKARPQGGSGGAKKKARRRKAGGGGGGVAEMQS
ncbi:KLHDC4 [Scenedesmus sp. PABB004]|nr:KLHDC4 [Scenedesmus sp. PABB004]